MSLTLKQLRRAAAYRPGRDKTEYEKPAMHHMAEHPVFETHKRVIRELGPVVRGESPNYKTHTDRWGNTFDRPISGHHRFVVKREVEKIIMGLDGKTPLHPKLVLTKMPDGTVQHKVQTTLVPVAKPRRLKAGSPRRVYQTLKRLEKRIGLDAVFAQLEKESLAA